MSQFAIAVFLVYFAAVFFNGGRCLTAESEPGAKISHLYNEVELNQNRILSISDTYSKEMSKLEDNYHAMEDKLEGVVNQLSGVNTKIMTMSLDFATLMQSLSNNNLTASGILTKVSKEVKNIKDSQESAVLALSEQLTQLRNSMSEMKQNMSKVLSKLQTPTDAAKLIEQNPTVMDISERLKALESTLLMDPPLKDTVKRTQAGLALIQNSLFPAVKQLRAQMAEVQQLVRHETEK